MNNEQLIMNNIEVFDVYGKKISSHHLINTSSHHLDISGLASGVYFVRITGEKGYSVQRFVKE